MSPGRPESSAATPDGTVPIQGPCVGSWIDGWSPTRPTAWVIHLYTAPFHVKQDPPDAMATMGCVRRQDATATTMLSGDTFQQRRSVT